MFINDIEDYFYLRRAEEWIFKCLKCFSYYMLMIKRFFAETSDGLRKGLDILKDYCTRCKRMVNTEKSKIMVFRKGGQLPRNLKFYYNNLELSIADTLSYLGFLRLVDHLA